MVATESIPNAPTASRSRARPRTATPTLRAGRWYERVRPAPVGPSPRTRVSASTSTWLPRGGRVLEVRRGASEGTASVFRRVRRNGEVIVSDPRLPVFHRTRALACSLGLTAEAPNKLTDGETSPVGMETSAPVPLRPRAGVPIGVGASLPSVKNSPRPGRGSPAPSVVTRGAGGRPGPRCSRPSMSATPTPCSALRRGRPAPFRLESARGRTADEYARAPHHARPARRRPGSVRAAALACVVPPRRHLRLRREQGLRRRAHGRRAWRQDGDAHPSGEPREVGADRIVNAVAAYERERRGLIVVDFGTATTLDVVSPKGEYLGVFHLPGVQIAAPTLFSRRRASRASNYPPRPLPRRNTCPRDAVGHRHGYVGLVDGSSASVSVRRWLPRARIADGRLARRLIAPSRAPSRWSTISHPRRPAHPLERNQLAARGRRPAPPRLRAMRLVRSCRRARRRRARRLRRRVARPRARRRYRCRPPRPRRVSALAGGSLAAVGALFQAPPAQPLGDPTRSACRRRRARGHRCRVLGAGGSPFAAFVGRAQATVAAVFSRPRASAARRRRGAAIAGLVFNACERALGCSSAPWPRRGARRRPCSLLLGVVTEEPQHAPPPSVPSPSPASPPLPSRRKPMNLLAPRRRHRRQPRRALSGARVAIFLAVPRSRWPRWWRCAGSSPSSGSSSPLRPRVAWQRPPLDGARFCRRRAPRHRRPARRSPEARHRALAALTAGGWLGPVIPDVCEE